MVRPIAVTPSTRRRDAGSAACAVSSHIRSRTSRLLARPVGLMLEAVAVRPRLSVHEIRCASAGIRLSCRSFRSDRCVATRLNRAAPPNPRSSGVRREHPRAEPPPRHRDPRPQVVGADRPQERRRLARRRHHDAGLRGPGGRRHRRGRRRQPADRSGLRHRGHHHRQLVPAGRRRRRRAGRRVHPHLFHGHALRGLRRRRRAPQPADPGQRREAFGAVQLRLGGGRERHQDRPHLHPQAGGGRRSITRTTAAPT